jgi:hypothetical protein
MLNGFCECRGIQFEIDDEINDFSHCHCSQCRRLHGAACATFAGVRRDKMHYTSGSELLAGYNSSATHERLFCKVCGSNIGVTLDEYPEIIYVSMSAIDGDPARPPAYHIFVGSKAPWHEINDDAPQFERSETE